MLVLSRAQAKHLRAMLRSTLLDQPLKGEWPLLVAQQDTKGSWLRSGKGEVAIRWELPREQVGRNLAFGSMLLAEIEKNQATPVTLEQTASGKGRATWEERGNRCAVDFDTVDPESLSEFPEVPAKFTSMPEGFLPALAEASRTTTKDNPRYALDRILLRGGQDGQVIATDGLQLLIHGGFRLPFSEDCLIPALKFFSRTNLWPEGTCQLARTDSHVFLRIGSWTLALLIDAMGRYPDVNGVVPKVQQRKCTLKLSAEDTMLLQQALPKLPGNEDDCAPVTLDLAGTPRVRARAMGSEEASELVLATSSVQGEPMQTALNRHYLLRALALGLHEFQLCSPDQPILASDPERTYLWMTLSNAERVPATAEVNRLPSNGQASNASVHQPPSKRRSKPVSGPSQNGDNHEKHQPVDSLAKLIEEAEALRRLHQQAGGRLSRLISALKQQRKQSKVFRQAVASLKQLELGD